jgi:hypothetical protein
MLLGPQALSFHAPLKLNVKSVHYGTLKHIYIHFNSNINYL